MRLSYQVVTLKLRHTFRTSREQSDLRRNVICRIEHGDLVGLGEAAPSTYYGQDAQTAVRAFESAGRVLGENPFDVEAISTEMARLLPQDLAARAAVDMAVHDIVGQSLDAPLYRLLGLDPQKTPRTSVTIGLDTIAVMRQKVAELKGAPILKIKLGTAEDVEIVRSIREMTSAVIRVDANAAWQAHQALERISALKDLGVEFVEQPLAADDLEGLRWLKKRVDLPIILDESVRTSRDIAKWAACADGINIKLMKCGGLREALCMIHVARALGLQVMLGCMVESSLAITAAAHLSPLVDYADLDGHLLIVDDPYVGVEVVEGRLVLPQRPGLGVVPADRPS